MEKENLATVLQTISHEPLSLVYISLPQCGVCHAILPRVAEVTTNLAIPAFQVDAAENPEVASHFQVLTVPAVLVFVDGKEVHRQARFIDVKKIQGLLEDYQQQDATIDYQTIFSEKN